MPRKLATPLSPGVKRRIEAQRSYWRFCSNWRRMCVLAALCRGGGDLMTAHAIAPMLGIDPMTAHDRLRDLCKAGLAVSVPVAKPGPRNVKRGRFLYRPAGLPPYGIHPKLSAL